MRAVALGLGVAASTLLAARLAAPRSAAPAARWSRDFPFEHRSRHFVLHHQRESWNAAEFGRIADAFVELVDRDFVPVHLERPLDVLVLPDRTAFHRYLRAALGVDLTPTGIYLPALAVFATYEDSGLGTFTHEIMHPIVERSLPDRPAWAFEGIPAFFEKFFGYWDRGRLVVQWGYQNPWRLEAIGAGLPRLDLARIVASAGTPTASLTSEQRLLTVFLWQHGRLERFLRLVAARDRAGFPSYLEAAMQRPLAQIVPLWRDYLADIAANRAAAMRIPASTVYPDQAAFTKALAELRPWLPGGASR